MALLADGTRAEVVIVVVDPQARRAQQAQREVVEASNADAVAAQDLRTVVREMRTAGIGLADLASILSVSTQRVSQLAAAGQGTSALQERRLERAHDARGP